MEKEALCANLDRAQRELSELEEKCESLEQKNKELSASKKKAGNLLNTAQLAAAKSLSLRLKLESDLEAALNQIKSLEMGLKNETENLNENRKLAEQESKRFEEENQNAQKRTQNLEEKNADLQRFIESQDGDFQKHLALEKENLELTELLGKMESMAEEAAEGAVREGRRVRELEGVLGRWRQLAVEQRVTVQQCREQFPKLFPEGKLPRPYLKDHYTNGIKIL